MNFNQIHSFKTASWITISVAFVGFALLIGGAVLTGIAYTEVRPNIADENYNRYMGANLQRTVGPVMLAFGTVMLVSGCIFMGFVMFATQSQQSSRPPSSKTSSSKEVY